ncbi:MAG: FtsX-like permease family protein, partial [Bacteroidota bacterium]
FDQIIGKQIQMGDNPDPFSIQLVYENMPNNSTLQADALISYASAIRYWGAGAGDSWSWSDFYHYLVLQPGADIQQLEAKFDGFSQQYFDESATGVKEVFELQALKAAHLYSTDLEYEIGQTANGRSIWVLLLIGLIILIIAWVNYVNLSSVKAIEKAKEVGVRKVIGAAKRQLVAQFLVEAFLINFIALTIALALVQVALRSLGAFLGTPFSLHYLFDGPGSSGQLIWLLVALMLLGIFSAAFYPAWLLGKQNVSNVLKGVYEKTGSSALLRKMLVVFQFAASVVLIIGTLMIFQQLQHMSRQDLGINVYQILVVDAPEFAQFDSTFIDRFNVFKNQLKQYSGIQSATMSNRMPGERTGRTFQIRSSVDPNAPSYTSGHISVDYDYSNTFDLPPVAGRAFRQEDHNFNGNLVDKLMINETAARLFGYNEIEEVVGQKLYTGDRSWTVIGVLPDFHQRSLHHPIEAIIFSPFLGTNNPLAIRLKGQDIEGSIDYIESQFEAFFPNNIFAYHFLDERFQQQYQSEQLFGRIVLFFTLLTIIIACLGLFGLASYTAFLRTKEIGIRKVLGSSISGITLLLSKDFLKLVCIAICIAIPIAWYMSNSWLATFHYHIELPWWTYLVAGSLVLGISFLTISYQSIKAAIMNPVEALRRE